MCAHLLPETEKDTAGEKSEKRERGHDGGDGTCVSEALITVTV